jgi:general stress protein YciG
MAKRDTKASSDRGFAAMDEEQQREIASRGGHSQGKENNPGNFANDRQRASEAGRKGGQASHGATSNMDMDDDQ